MKPPLYINILNKIEKTKAEQKTGSNKVAERPNQARQANQKEDELYK